MIQLSAALAINHATAVELEATRCTNSHTDRLLGDSLHQSCLIILWHILVPINGHHIPVGQTDQALNTAERPCQANFKKRRRAVRHSQKFAAMQAHARPWL